jgi:hypothetical protein
MNYGTVAGQQGGVANNSQSKKGAKGPAHPPAHAPAHAPAHNQGGEGSSSQPEGPPPTYADVIKGDHKVQGP